MAADAVAKQLAVFAAIERAANSGSSCPTNSELCGFSHYESVSGPVAAMGRLERAGLIRVERFQSARRVTICATGKATHVHQKMMRDHWRDRTGRDVTKAGHGAAIAERVAKEKPDDLNLPSFVSRDPCPCCGTRSDIGCHHNVTRISMGAFA